MADCLLIDLVNVDLQTGDSFNRNIAFSNQLTLADGFVGVAFTFGGNPERIVVALLMALLMQILDRFKSNRATTIQGDVLAALKLGKLIGLISFTLEYQVAAGLDFSTDVGNASDLVALGFLGTPAAVFLHVIQRMRAVLRRQQTQLIPAIQISLIPRADPARHDRGVTPGLADKIPTRRQYAGHLGGLLVCGLDAFLAVLFLAIDVVHVADRGDVEVAAGGDGEVFAGGGSAADDVDILPGLHVDAAARRDAGGDEVEVAAGGEVGVVAGGEGASVGEVAAGVDGEVFAGDDGAAAAVGEGAHAGAVTHLDGGGFVGDVAFERREADLFAANLAGHGVADAVLGQQAQVVAGLDQADGVDAAAVTPCTVLGEGLIVQLSPIRRSGLAT